MQSKFIDRITAMEGNRWIWAIITLLMVWSILLSFSTLSSLAYKNYSGILSYVMNKHVVYLVVGLLMVMIIHKINYRKYALYTKHILIASIILLILTLLIGKEVNGAARWLEIPLIGFQFQTSEFAKLGLVIYLAHLISVKRKETESLEVFLKGISPTFIIVVFITPANLSSALLMFMVAMMMMFLGRFNLKYLAITAGGLMAVLIIAIGILAFIPDSYLKDTGRVLTWKHRVLGDGGTEEIGFQEQQAYITLTEGNFFVGTGATYTPQATALPYAYNDYIFCIIVAQFGLFGAFLIITIYIMLFIACINIFKDSEGSFGALLVLGLSMLIVVQAFVHIAVNIGWFFPTGITLPLVSKGGSSIFSTCIALGIILSVSRYNEKKRSLSTSHHKAQPTILK